MLKKIFWVWLMGMCCAVQPSWALLIGEQGTGNATAGSANSVRTTQYVCTENGTVNQIYLYIATAAGNGRVAIYASGGANSPGALMAESSSQTLSEGWNLFSIPNTGVTTETTYWLACVFDNDSVMVGYYGDDPYDYRGRRSDMTFGPFVDPFSVTNITYYPNRYCIYATDGAFSPTPSPSPICSPTPSMTATRSTTPTPSRTATPSVTPTLPALSTRTPSATLTVTAWNPGKIITYPSPARGDKLWFYYYVDSTATVQIEIRTITGELAATLADQTNASGYQRTVWGIRQAAPGIYLYRVTITTGAGKKNSDWQKLVIVK